MAIIDGTTFLYSIEDCKIREVLTDNETSITYGNAIDIPGIKSVVARFTTEEKELRGDSKTLDRRTTLKDVELSIEHAVLSHEALAVIVGGETALTGTTPNRKHKWTVATGDKPRYFSIEFRVVEVDGEGADFHFKAYKAKLTGSPELGAMGDDYKSASFSCKAIPTIHDGSWWDTTINETATAIS